MVYPTPDLPQYQPPQAAEQLPGPLPESVRPAVTPTLAPAAPPEVQPTAEVRQPATPTITHEPLAIPQATAEPLPIIPVVDAGDPSDAIEVAVAQAHKAEPIELGPLESLIGEHPTES